MRHGIGHSRFYKRSYTLNILSLLPWMIIVPAIVLFFTEMNGPNLSAGIRNAFDSLFSFRGGISFWPFILAGTFFMLMYTGPINAFWCELRSGGKASGLPCALVLKRLDHLAPVIIAINLLVFGLGSLIKAHQSEQSQFFFTPRIYTFMEACSVGLMLGVLQFVNIENMLFPARKAILMAYPELTPRKSSLFGKIFIIITAIVIFMVFQIFSSAGVFFSLGARGVPLPGGMGPPGVDRGTAFLHSDAIRWLKDSLAVFYARMAAFIVIVSQLLWQIKITIVRPLEIIRGKLSALNAANPEPGERIQIIWNDEFAQVYREINRLIERQTGELQSSRDRLDNITSNAADPIIVYGEGGIVEAFNPAAERYFGYEAAQVVGKDFSGFLGPLGEAEVDVAGFAVPAEPTAGFMRYQARAKDGKLLRFEAHAAKSIGPSGAVVTVILRDVSHQVEIEENLLKARRAAETANRLKSEFLANMSHELRTPLNAVLGFTQLLSADKNLTDGQLSKVDIISRSGEHLLALINDILDISKIEAGKVEMHTVVFNLERFIEDIREMFALKCKSKGLSLYVELTGDLPSYVEGDLGKLRQIVINLVGNAVKFTSEGGVGITVGPEEKGFRFAISDSGKGIPAEELDLILKPFMQSSITDNEGGTGLGLAISSSFIEMMGGSLDIQSEVGKGSVFSFVVELKATDRIPEGESRKPVPVAVKRGSSVTALIVDDKEVNRLVLKELLEAAGFGTLEAENGREAVRIALERRPALVFMDIRMPEMDGYAAVEALRRTEEGRAMKVFALTASAFKHDEERIFASGFDGFLAKPFKKAQLFQLIAEKTDIAMEYEDGAGPAKPALADPASIDYARAGAELGAEEIERFANFALINDFAGAKAFGENLERSLPDLASLISYYADSFDEKGLGDLVGALRKG